MSRAVLTHKEKERMKDLGEANNKLRWFFVAQPLQCKLLTLDVGWYEKTGSRKLKDNWLHSIKHKRTKDTFTISDKDYLKLVSTFEKENVHLF